MKKNKPQPVIIAAATGLALCLGLGAVAASAAELSNGGFMVRTVDRDNFEGFAGMKPKGGNGGDPGTENPGGENPGGENPGGENPGGENPGTENPGGVDPAAAIAAYSINGLDHDDTGIGWRTTAAPLGEPNQDYETREVPDGYTVDWYFEQQMNGTQSSPFEEGTKFSSGSTAVLPWTEVVADPKTNQKLNATTSLRYGFVRVHAKFYYGDELVKESIRLRVRFTETTVGTGASAKVYYKVDEREIAD